MTVKIPDEMEEDLASYTAKSGHYMNTSELVRDALRRFLEENATQPDGCSIEYVIEELREGVPVEFQSWDESGGGLVARNPFENYCVVLSGTKTGPNGDELGNFRSELSPGEEQKFGIGYKHGSTENTRTEIEAFAGEPDSDGRCRSATDQIPINGEEVLLLEEGSYTENE